MKWIPIPCDIPNSEDYKLETISIGVNDEARASDYNYLIRITHRLSEDIEESVGTVNVAISTNLRYVKGTIYSPNGMFHSLYEDFSVSPSAGIKGCLKRQAERVFGILVGNGNG